MKYQYLLLLLSGVFLFGCGKSIQGRMVDQMIENGFRTDSGKNIKIPDYQDEQTKVFYLVRHAEKELNGDNPGLTEEGMTRAKKLAHILSDVKINGIYSTNYKRTIYTAAPTAEVQKLEVNSYNHKEQADLVKQLTAGAPNQHFLIVGHSNSIPNMLNLFQDNKVYPAIDESIYDNLFVVVVDGEQNAKVFELKY